MAQRIDEGSFDTAAVTLEEDSKATSSGENAFVTLSFADGSTVKAYADFGETQPLLHGTKASISGTWVKPDWNRDEYLWRNGAIGRVHVAAFDENRIESALAAILQARRMAIVFIGDEDDAHALLQAIVCGYRHSVSSTTMYACFQRCGVAHLVAVSGAHLVIVTGLIAVVLKSLHVGKRASVSVLAATMASYLVFSGAPISALRATVMTSIGMFSIFGQRRPSALNALGIGIFAIVLASPTSSVSTSFALSALSTAGIVVFAPLFTYWFEQLPFVRMPLLSGALSMTFAANALSQLYACSVFSILPVIGPLANIACAPLFPIVCAMGLACALVSISGLPIASALLGIASLLSTALCETVRALAAFPYSSIPLHIESLAALLCSSLLASALWVFWPWVKAQYIAILGTCAFLVFILFSFAASQEDAIIMLDVGQGDSFIVRSRGSTLLVDTGNMDSQLIDQLARCSITKLDSVLLTHSDDDHVGSLDALERSVHVDRILIATDMLSSTEEKNMLLVKQADHTADKVMGVCAGDVFQVGDFTAHVVWPHVFSDDGGNADSVCLLLEYDGNRDGVTDFNAFFTGDAEQAQIESILKEQDIGSIDILKVGHHGSKDGMSLSQLEALDPKICLIGVGKGNRYGHPADETLDMLASIGCKVYRSDIDGQVKCLFSSDAIRVGIQ